MKIRIVAFATASDVVGKGPLDVTLAEGSRVGELRDELLARFPHLEPLWPRLAIAVDGELIRESDAELRDGAEVALLPPVSGGSPRADAADTAERVALTERAIDVAAVERAVADPSCGAIVVFLGTVRDHTVRDQRRGRDVERLTYSAYAPMARAALERIVRDLESGPEPVRAAIVHRLGDVSLGEPSVAIAVASPHRAAAYDKSRMALERLKREVPIWKREHYADGEAAWREEEPLVTGCPGTARD